MIPARIGRGVAGLLVALSLGLAAAPAGAQSSAAGPAFGPIRLLGDEPSYLGLGAGAFNTQAHRTSPTAAEGTVEFRYGRKLFFIGPALGLLANTRGGVFGYGGLYGDLQWDHVVVTPLAAAGGYHRGGGEDLGNVFEFRLSLAVAYQFNDRSRLGVQFSHISDAGISNRNPGENELLLTYSIPLRLPF